MAAVEFLEQERVTGPYLRLVSGADPVYRAGPTLAERRAVRARQHVRRRRATLAAVVLAASAVLLVPGHVFGATTGTGLPTDIATSSVLASGMDYVVQPGDTVDSIARLMNPVDPAYARALLVKALGSDAVVPGEHVVIP